MVATIRLPEVRLAATSTAAAGDGRVWLGPAAVRDLGVQLGDPVVVDVRVGGGGSGEPSTSDAETWPWSFLATAAPTPVQGDSAVAGVASSADEAVILDTTTRLPGDAGDAGDAAVSGSRELEFPGEFSGESLEGRARALYHGGEICMPPACASLRVFAPGFDTPGGAESLRRLLTYRLVAVGASVRLDGERERSANASASVVVVAAEPSDAPAVRVVASTAVAFARDLSRVTKPNPKNPKNPSASERIAGADEALQTLRECVVWPTRYAADAAALGASFPRGVLLHGPPGVGKTASAVAVAREAGAKLVALSAGDVFGPYAGDAEARLRGAFRDADAACAEGTPCVILLDEIDAMCPARGADAGLSGSRVVAQLLTLMDDGGVEARRATDGPTAATTLRPAVVATTNRPNALDPALRRPGRFDVEVEISLPSAKQRLAILRVHARALPLARDVDLEQVARTAKGYSGADLAALCREAAMASIRDAAGGFAPSFGEPNDGDEEVAGDGSLVTARHFSTAAGRVGASVTRGAALEFSATTWDDVGGLDDVKKRLKQAVEWPLRHAAAFRRLGLAPPRGVLLHGPPGCAKTTLARAAATASGATVIALSAADVFSKYVGEGERALRDAFARARRAAPAILLLDEIDGMVGNRGAAKDASSGGGADENTGNDVAARVLSAFLVEMDGLEVGGGDGDDGDDERRDGDGVLVVATTNRPNALDAALTRPGRLDLVLYVPPPDARGREAALRVHARGVPLAADVDLRAVATRTERFTGAELRGVIREAALAALREDLGAEQVTAAHVDAALRATRPALAESDLAKWASFRA